MIKSILDKISKELISAINLSLVKLLKKQIDADLAKIADRTRLYSDSQQDSIDFYSSHIEEELKIKNDLLLKYLHQLRLIEAVMLVIGQKKKEEAALLLDIDMPIQERESKLKGIRLTISRLIIKKIMNNENK